MTTNAATMTPEAIAAYLAEHRAAFDKARAEWSTWKLRDKVRTGDYTLTVQSRSYPVGTEVEDVTSGRAVPESVTVTEDGRSAWTNVWHRLDVDGPEAAMVYVERWNTRGRVFHGYVDSISRKLVQVG